MNLRKIGTQDWESYRDFRLAIHASPDAPLFGGSYEKESVRTEEEWKQRLLSSDHRFYYGYFNENNKLIAAAGAYLNTVDDGLKNNWVLVGVYTNKEFRNQGLSRNILLTIFNELHLKGVDRVLLTVNVENNAVDLYKKLGFTTIDVTTGHIARDGQVHDEFVMEKALI